jgi:hypothetical protein
MHHVSGKIDDKKEACKTYIEQTKLLVTLSSAFLVAPPAMLELIHAEKGTPAITEVSLTQLMIAEFLFIASVLAGYVVLGSITGSQDDGTFDVFRGATRLWSIAQFLLYVCGLVFFVLLVRGIVKPG